MAFTTSMTSNFGDDLLWFNNGSLKSILFHCCLESNYIPIVGLFTFFFQPFNFAKSLIVNCLLVNCVWNLVFLTLVNKKWSMLTKEFVKQAYMLNFGWRMHLMNGDRFMVLTKNIHNKCLQKWIHCKRSCGDVVLGCVHINMNHMTNNQCLVFHVFWSNFILMLQVFDLFTCQCSFIFY
jgi:hypothetical protein